MKALLIVDLQNDFLPGGALGVPGGDQIVPIVNELIPEYDLVVATQDWHPEDHGSFVSSHPNHRVGEVVDLNGMDQVLWPVHCVEGTSGANFAPELNHLRLDHIVRKGCDPGVDSYSGFFDNERKYDTGLTAFLRERGVTEVHVVGLAIDYCVKYTALDSVAQEFSTALIVDACRGVELQEGDGERAIDEMRENGVLIMNSVEILGSEVTLYRPVGPEEYALLKECDFRAWPPRLPEQPIFYPVMNEAYAEQIARDWNIPASGSAYVTRFEVDRNYLRQFPRKVVGAGMHEELWIPAEDLETMNRYLRGKIEVISTL